MTFTYNPALTDPISQVRDVVRDIEPDFYTFEDETIQYYLDTSGGDVLGAAQQAAFRLYMDYSNAPEVSEVDGTRIENRAKAASYKAIYEELKREASKSKVFSSKRPPIHFGGLNRAQFNANRENRSITPPDFDKDMPYFNKDYPELTQVGETPLRYTDEF